MKTDDPPPTEIIGTTALAGGEVTDDGGDLETKGGICYGRYEHPEYPPRPGMDTCTEDREGKGIFTSQMTGLIGGYTYHYRAYAYNTHPEAPAYGDEYYFIAGSEQGETCSIDVECRTGHCVDGVCCNSDCPETCYNCAVPENEGVCMLAPEGMQGRNCFGACRACNGAGQCVFTPAGQQDSSCDAACWTCDGAGNCTAQTAYYGAATALGCMAGQEDCRRCNAGSCTYYSDNAQHDCNTCNACNASGNCTARTVDGASATALGCTAGQEGCRRCNAGSCTYYTNNAQHNCSACYSCGALGRCYGRTAYGSAATVLGCTTASSEACRRCSSGSCVNIGSSYYLINSDLAMKCWNNGANFRMWPRPQDCDGTNDNENLQWGGYGINNPDDSCIGDGSSHPACDYCDDLSWKGYNDWYLPTISQLVDLWTNRTSYSISYTGDFTWSSTELVSGTHKHAYEVYFGSGVMSYRIKYNWYNIRCVRGD